MSSTPDTGATLDQWCSLKPLDHPVNVELRALRQVRIALRTFVEEALTEVNDSGGPSDYFRGCMRAARGVLNDPALPDIGRPVRPHGSGGGGDNLAPYLPPWYIIVNGKNYDLPEETRQLTYEELVLIARSGIGNRERSLYTITYAKGFPPRTEGTIQPGESVEIASGMVFDVLVTDRA